MADLVLRSPCEHGLIPMHGRFERDDLGYLVDLQCPGGTETILDLDRVLDGMWRYTDEDADSLTEHVTVADVLAALEEDA